MHLLLNFPPELYSNLMDRIWQYQHSGLTFNLLEPDMEPEQVRRSLPRAKRPAPIKAPKTTRRNWDKASGCAQCGDWQTSYSSPIGKLCGICAEVHNRSVKHWRPNPDFGTPSPAVFTGRGAA